MFPDAVKTLLHGSLTGESHPGRPLFDHLGGVADLSLELARLHGILDANEKELLAQIALTHDIGKERVRWQRYLHGEGEQVPHSEISSFFTFDVTKNVMAAELVRSHHGRMQNLQEVMTNFWGNDSFSIQAARAQMKESLPNWEFLLSNDEWESIIENWIFSSTPVDQKSWLLARTLFSLFISADRMNAIGALKVQMPPLPQIMSPTFSTSSPLDPWRNEVRKACLNNSSNAGDPGIYTLTLPTGAGKTTIGLEIASHWAKIHGYQSIVYVLPFISIVEQNADVARQLFGKNYVQEDHSMAAAKHGTENTDPLEKMESLFRYWRLPVVTTTMAHFWEALYGARANATMNFHRFGKAVVILDEPQAISTDHWTGLGNTLRLLSSQWRTAFILMTATQPHIVKKNVVEIAAEKHRKPHVNRHRYKIMQEKQPLESFPELLQSHIPLEATSGLVVANTRREARELYRMLHSLLPESKGEKEVGKLPQAPVFFLSTWLTPKHRRKTLEELRRLEKDDLPRFLVSTQVVEAGVDLDFHWVVRDFGPFDSIVQVAGRCNRHNRRNEEGTVLVVKFINKQGRSFASMIYNSVHLNAMEEISSETSEFSENAITEVMDRYYSIVSAGTKGSGLWQKITDGEWGELPPLYEKTSTDLITLVIELDPEVRILVNRLLLEEWTIENLEDKKRLMNEIHQYAIEIPQKMLSECRKRLSSFFFKDSEPLKQIGTTDMWFLSEEASNILYDPVTGFIPPEKEEENVDGVFL